MGAPAALIQTQRRCYTRFLWRPENFLSSESGKLQFPFSHFTRQTVSFYLTLQFIQQLLQLVDLRAPVLLIFCADLWNKTNKLFYICVISGHLEFLSIFWQVDVKWFSYSQVQVNKSLSPHPTCGQGSSVGDWRYASFILDPASASPATPLCVCLLHVGYFPAAEETVNQHQTITVSEMRI